MRKLSYRNRLRLKRFAHRLCIVLLVLGVISVFLFIYLQRYVVYTQDGASLDFERTTVDIPMGTTADNEKTSSLGEVEIEFKENTTSMNANLKRLNGVYITTQMLRENASELMDAVEKLDSNTPVMIDVKAPDGSFYYSTTIADTKKANTATLDALITYLTQNGFPMIARLPAFADSAYAKAHPELALTMDEENLWKDEDGTYWLNPEKPTVLAYQEQICKELSSFGFREIVFEGFYFPTSGSILYTANKTRTELIAQAAKELENAFAGSNLTVSFSLSDASLSLNHLSGRLYAENVSAANADQFAASFDSLMSDSKIQMVYLTNSRDSRFDSFSRMRPLIEDDRTEVELQNEQSVHQKDPG